MSLIAELLIVHVMVFTFIFLIELAFDFCLSSKTHNIIMSSGKDIFKQIKF